jgi:hypothetical protein
MFPRSKSPESVRKTAIIIKFPYAHNPVPPFQAVKNVPGVYFKKLVSGVCFR